MWEFLVSFYYFFWHTLFGLSESPSVLWARSLGWSVFHLHEVILALVSFYAFIITILLIIKRRKR